MKLTDLNPKFVGHGGDAMTHKDGKPVPWRRGVALSFDCPCGGICGQRAVLYLNPPMDGGAPLPETTTWKRVGDTFDVMTLTPSINRKAACKWHGFLTKGELTRV